MNKYKVEDRIKADIEFEEIVEVSSEDAAMKKAEKIIYDRCGINKYSVIDDEIYVEKIKNETK